MMSAEWSSSIPPSPASRWASSREAICSAPSAALLTKRPGPMFRGAGRGGPTQHRITRFAKGEIVMSMYDPQMTGRPVPLQYGTDTRDAAVVRFFNAVYAWMAVGLAVTASVAWLVFTHPAVMKSVLSGGAMIGI